MSNSSAVSIRQVKKFYGNFTAISGMSFDIADNEFFTLLGPSGCGKTTLLRMIAGFDETSEGEIFLYGEEIEKLPPNKRPVNTVFQNYALFPHMDVATNIGFGLNMLGWSTADIQERVEQMIHTVKLEEFAHRKPFQLSGGQQQRVALARAMAPKPKVLLLDEPLSALDLKLRQQMRMELKLLQQETGITFIFVTHDQEEALSMSDRIAVMSAGEVQQIGTPAEIYEYPVNRFVADFIGETNLLEASVLELNDGQALCHLANGDSITARCDTSSVSLNDKGHVLIRPERMSLAAKPSQAQHFVGALTQTVYLGTDRLQEVAVTDNVSVTVRMQNTVSDTSDIETGDRVYASIDDGAARFLSN